MNKLDWITWKTEENELINVKEVISNLVLKFQDYNSYMNPVVYESIKYELSNGGLRKECFVIDGRSPATEVANKIISDIISSLTVVRDKKLPKPYFIRVLGVLICLKKCVR